MTTRLTDFFRYNLWANLCLLDACAQLTDEQLDMTMLGTFGSIRETLTHIFSSEEGYAQHFQFTGPNPTPKLKEYTTFAGFEELRRRATRSGNELLVMAERANLSQIMHLDDGTYDAPSIILLLQAVNHGIDHRSQIATLLAMQGIELPALDGWAYNDATI